MYVSGDDLHVFKRNTDILTDCLTACLTDCLTEIFRCFEDIFIHLRKT